MSILRKRGKEKLRFKIMNNRVPNPIFKNLKGLIIKSLNENADMAEKLDKYYKLIQICFFYEAKDPNVENTIREILRNPSLTYSLKSDPAFAQSENNIGCILIFVKHLLDKAEKREELVNAENYYKNGLFEELCHLVEQKGDSSIHPSSYGKLWQLYRNKNLLFYGEEILAKLDADRNHYEVYSMMIVPYPNDWVERYWKYFIKTPEQFRQQYEQQKTNTPTNIVYARLVTDLLRSVNFLYVAEKAKKEKLTDKNKKLLADLLETGKKDVEGKRYLIERDMGFGALSLINSLDEAVFKTPKIFFSVIFDLWKNLKLI